MHDDATITFDPRWVRDVLEDPARLAAIRRLRLHDHGKQDRHERLTGVAARVLGAQVCLVSVVEADRQVFGGGSEHDATPLTHSFCQYVVASDAVLAVEDAARHEVLRHNGAHTELGLRGYLGVPLRSSDGHVLGSLCVIDDGPRSWDDAARDLLEVLADAVVAEAELAASARSLEEASTALATRSRSTEELLEIVQSRRHEDRRRLAGDVHDTALQDLIAARMLLDGEQSAEEHANARECVESALGALRRIMDGLAPIELPHADPSTYVADRVAEVSSCFGMRAMCDIDLGSIVGSPELKALTHRATLELVRNACRHAGGSSVEVRARRDGRAIRVEVRDEGSGWDPAQASGGAGLRLLAEELHGVGGTLYGTHADGGFLVTATIPCRALAEVAA